MNKRLTADKVTEYNRAFLVKRRAALSRLKAVPCMDCGGNFPPVAMDFDHVRGEKEFSIAACAKFSWARLMEEIGKCDVVCANCHRIRTHNRRQEKYL